MVATVLLLSQTGGGALVALVHAREAPTAPRTIEAVHDARCAVVHDALHCVVCQLASHRLPPGRTVMPWWPDAARATPIAIRTVALPADGHDPTARPRAPPLTRK